MMERKVRYCCDKWDEYLGGYDVTRKEYEEQEHCQFCGGKIQERVRKIEAIWVDFETPNAFCGDPEYGYRISLAELKKALEET